MTASLRVERVGPGATVQDAGRPGLMHEGVPNGGPLDPALFARTQGSLGNRGGAAVELPWHGARLRAQGALVVSVDGEVRSLADGESLDVPAAPYAVRYVGLRGGVDVPVVLGGRGTLLVASLGGLDGRMLRAGDVLRAGDACEGDATSQVTGVDLAREITVVTGPDAFDPVSLEALFSRPFTVTPQVDRVGMRLRGEGVRPPGDGTERSRPMVRGAIEVTPDGTLIVLGPDHPTTGGYPVIAVVTVEGQGALAQRRPGDVVRFTRGPRRLPRART